MKIAIPMSTSKTQYYLNQAYVDYVAEAGLEPVLVAPSSDVKAMASECDGLILPGGIDLEPTFYGENNVASFGADPNKDNFERDLFYAFVAEHKLIFGICRGFQLIVREYLRHNEKDDKWLTYYQNLSDHSLADKLSVARNLGTHMVKVRADLYGGKRNDHELIFTNSMHHQAVIMEDALKPNKSRLQIVATNREGLSPKYDKGLTVVEGIRIEDQHTHILAVQWHPEEMRDYALIQRFFGVEVYEDEEEEAMEIGL